MTDKTPKTKKEKLDIFETVGKTAADDTTEEIKNRVVEDMAELFKSIEDDMCRTILGFALIIMAHNRRRELDEQEKEEKKE